MSTGHLFIVSAPSGTGKSTLIRRLFEKGMGDAGDLVHSVSHTTRKPRRGERDGRDYYFVDRTTFEAMIKAQEFLEWAEVFGDYKGTSLREVDLRLHTGIDVILDIDVQGALQVLATRPTATFIFILPPNRTEMERRLRTRRLDEPEQVARRLALSRSEIERYGSYDYAIINDDLERASEALATIILDKRYRRERLEPQIQSILESFGSPGDDSSND